MKKKDKQIDELVDQTLQAFDGIERAKPKPFLYTRLKGRMESQKDSVSRHGILSPVFQRITVVLVLLVLVVNIFTTTQLINQSTTENSLKVEEQEFMEEYYPSTPTLYSINQTTVNP